MGKRGPKANPESRKLNGSFYAPKPCHESIEALQLEHETVGDVICMSIELATRFPDEFEKIRQERASESDTQT